MKFSELSLGDQFIFQTSTATTIGPLLKVSSTSAKGNTGTTFEMHDAVDCTLTYRHLARREFSRREAWEYLAWEWHGSKQAENGKWLAMERESLHRCISSMWMDNLLSYNDKEVMQKQLGKTSWGDEDLFGTDEESAKNRVGFCLERAIAEVDPSEILECDGHGMHFWKSDKGSRPAYGWIFESDRKECNTWEVMCYNCGFNAMKYDYSPEKQSNGMLFRPIVKKPIAPTNYSRTPVQTVVAKKEVSVYSSKTGLAHSDQGSGFVLK